MNLYIFDIIGLLGAFLYIFSYAILQFRRDFAKKLSYSVINLLAAGLVVISLTQDFNLSSLIIQTTWIMISLFGIYRSIKYKLKDEKEPF